MSIITEPPAIDLDAVLPAEPNRDVQHHVQIAVWFAVHPGLPQTDMDGLRTAFTAGSVEQNMIRVDEVAGYLGVETVSEGTLYSARCEITGGIFYEAFCSTVCPVAQVTGAAA